jgi:hypothetical protein
MLARRRPLLTAVALLLLATAAGGSRLRRHHGAAARQHQRRHAAARAKAALAVSALELEVGHHTKRMGHHAQHGGRAQVHSTHRGTTRSLAPADGAGADLSPQTGRSALNPRQTAFAVPGLPAKYTTHSVKLMNDKFDSTETITHDWAIPADMPVDQMGFEQPVGLPANMWFAGRQVGKTPLRSKRAFEWPFTVVAEVDRAHKCSDHFILLSTKPDLKFSWGYEAGTVKLVQNCDTKQVYSNNLDGTPHAGAKTTVHAPTALGAATWEVVVSDVTITFKDDKSPPITVPNNLGRKPIYVYVGADQDAPGQKSRFYKLMVLAPPKADSMGADVVFGDDFAFLNDTRPREWSKRPEEGSEVDYGCGGMVGNPSLRFQGPERDIVSKPFDFHRGGVVETCVRYGSDAADVDAKHTCSAMDDHDGMELQASTDGVSFTSVLRLVKGQFPELTSSNFTCLRTTISGKAYPRFMSSKLWLRWRQMSDADPDIRKLYRDHQVRGNWALGRVRAISAPEPARKVIFEDAMVNAKPRPDLWAYPASSSQCPQWGVGQDGFWMGGRRLAGADCPLARSQQLFQAPLVLEMNVAKHDKCASHIVMLSKDKRAVYAGSDKAPSNGAFAFGWDCDTKFILGPSEAISGTGSVGKLTKLTDAKCARKASYKVEIIVEADHILFKDDRCETLTLPIAPHDGSPFYVHVGADNYEGGAGAQSKFTSFRVLQLVDVLGHGFGNIFETTMVKDTFTKDEDIKKELWVPPVIRADANGTQPTYGYETAEAEGNMRGLWFKGAFGGNTPMRTVESFAYPFATRFTMVKDEKCNNHFVVLSSKRDARWSWGSEANTVKIGWNCDTKYIYGPDEASSATVPCAGKGEYAVDIKVFEGMISFTDDKCGTISVLNPLGADDPDTELYVYFGGDQDAMGRSDGGGLSIRAVYSAMQITGPERPPQIKNRLVLMQDDFDFRKSVYEPMWEMDDTTGVSDQVCGSVAGNAMHFGNAGLRVATSHPVDASKGARLEFSIRFGGSSINCGKFTDPENDGVEVQYSVDGGATWKKLVRYIAAKWPQFASRFTEVNSVIVDDSSHADALTRSTMFRWIQINRKARPCCGHWALDDVQIKSLESEGDVVVDDTFHDGEDTKAWSFPVLGANDKCTFTLGKRMLEFKGRCTDEAEDGSPGPTDGAPTLRNNRPLNGEAGVVIETELKKDWRCPNHVVAISTQQALNLRSGPQPNTVKFGWNCDLKYIQTPTGIHKIECGGDGTLKTLIRIEDGKATFDDNQDCERITVDVPKSVGGTLFHAFVGSMQDTSRGMPRDTSKFVSVKIEQSVPDPFDSFSMPIVTDDFSERKRKVWVYPNATQRQPGSQDVCRFRLDEKFGEARFSGNCTGGNVGMRLKNPTPTPFNVLADINKHAKCANQYIMLSPKKDDVFSFEPRAGVVTLGWSCDEKYLAAVDNNPWALKVGSNEAAAGKNNAGKNFTVKEDSLNLRADGGTPAVVERYHCDKRGENKLTVRVESSVISFRDANCNVLVAKNPFPFGTELYVSIGASPELSIEDKGESSEESTFSMLSIEGPAQPPTLDEGVVMYDGFDYRGNLWPDMWTQSETTGKADKECGSKSGNSLRFYNPGVRVATTKPVDIRHGGDLKFYIHFGESEGPTCKRMSVNTLKDGQKVLDGVRVQYSHDARKDGSNDLAVDGAGEDGAGFGVQVGGATDDLLTKSDRRHTVSNQTDDGTGTVWYDLADYTVLKYGQEFGDGFVKINIPMDYDTNVGAIGSAVRIRWIQRNNDAQECCDHWALDEVEIKAHPAPKRPSGLDNDFLIRDTFVSDRYGANPIFWDMYETSGRAGEIQNVCDVRPPKLTAAQSHKVLRFDGDGPRKVTTQTLDLKPGAGASISFFLTFQPAGLDVATTNVSDAVGVDLEYSTDQGRIWKTLDTYTPAVYKEAIGGCARIRAEVDGTNNTQAYSDSVRFRLSQQSGVDTSRRSGQRLRPAWAIDGVEVRTGKLRIGFEDFDTDSKDTHKWCYQSQSEITPYNYTVGSKTGSNDPFMLAFQGNAFGKGTVRSHMSFNAPLEVSTTLLRSETCANHFIALSPRRYFTWNWAPDETSIKLAWHCNEKVAIHGKPGITGGVRSTKTPCTEKGEFEVKLKVSGNRVTFRDNKCETISFDVDPAVLRDFYVYVGAAQPVTEYDREKLEVLAAPVGAARMARCDRIVCSALNVSQPVCGSDGVTYDSYCALSVATCRNNVQKVRDGACVPLPAIAPSQFTAVIITGRGSYAEHKDDGKAACPVKQDCDVGPFTEWSNCSTPCGPGISTRNRSIFTPPANTGKACPVLQETRTCNLRKCDCGVSEWSEYGLCDVPCGGGKSYRHRDIFREPMLEGLQCPAMNESRACNSKPCARVGLPVVPERVKKMLHEQKAEMFTRMDKSKGGWCYQEAGELAPYSYGYTGKGMGGVWFSGDSTNRTSMRSHASFGTDHGDLFLQAEISKNSECSNHFLVLSKDPYYRWTWNPEPDTFKMVWKCGRKSIIYPTGTKSVPCGELRNYKLSIRVKHDRVVFGDDLCEDVVAPVGPEAKDLFLYVGANYVEEDSNGTATNDNEESMDQSGDENTKGKENGEENTGGNAKAAVSFIEESMVVQARRRISSRRLRHNKKQEDKGVVKTASAIVKELATGEEKGTCGSESIPWSEVSCNTQTGAVAADGEKVASPVKCLVSDAMLLKGNDGSSYFDANKLEKKVAECKEREDCVGIQKIIHAQRNPGRYSLRSGYEMAIAPNRGPMRQASFCPKVSAAEIMKVASEDRAVQDGSADEDADGEAEDLPKDDRRPAPGWTLATPKNLAALKAEAMESVENDVKYEYRFKKGNAWYISPPTTKVWDWENYATVTGTWSYGDEDENTGDFECLGASDNGVLKACGLGCSTGGGAKFKVLPRCDDGGEKDEDAGLLTLCQDRPDAFGTGSKKPCAENVHVSFHKIVKPRLSAAEASEKRSAELLAKQNEEEELLLDGESDVADAALQAAETPAENEEDQVPGEPNRAVFKMLRVSGMDSVTNRVHGSGICPRMIDCEVSDWTEWSNCSLPCDGGNSTRTREILVTPEFGGRLCPAMVESRACNTRECDCGVTEFGSYTVCDRECGGGTSSRSRTIFREPLGDGELCPALNESVSCNVDPCAVVGLPHEGVTEVRLENAPVVDLTRVIKSSVDFENDPEWCFQNQDTLAPYEYNFTRGEGMFFKGVAKGKSTLRSRRSFRLPLRIEASFERKVRCNNHYIVLSPDPYYTWPSGDDDAIQEPDTLKFFYDCNNRRVLAPPRSSGDESKGGTYEKHCARHVRPLVSATIDLSFSSKSYFEDTTCGRTDISWMDVLGPFAGKDLFLYVGAARPQVPWVDRGRTVFTSIRVSGNGSLINTVNGSGACPRQQDCLVTPWSEFSQCTAPCNGGNHTRSRSVVRYPKHKGKECPVLSQKTACNTQHCGIDCVVTEWSEWGNCSKVCGGGIAKRNRDIFVDGLNGTLYGHDQCPALEEERECNTQICGRDCIVSEWVPWSACSAPCGGGGRKRLRSVLVEPITGSHAGKQCPHLEESESCNTQACPVHVGPEPIYDSK